MEPFLEITEERKKELKSLIDLSRKDLETKNDDETDSRIKNTFGISYEDLNFINQDIDRRVRKSIRPDERWSEESIRIFVGNTQMLFATWLFERNQKAVKES